MRMCVCACARVHVQVAGGMRVLFAWHIVAYYAICSCGMWRVCAMCHVHVRMCHVAYVAFGHHVHVCMCTWMRHAYMRHAHVANGMWAVSKLSPILGMWAGAMCLCGTCACVDSCVLVMICHVACACACAYVHAQVACGMRHNMRMRHAARVCHVPICACVRVHVRAVCEGGEGVACARV
jgi:hypothetical protein